jgi:dihydrodipicolinate synthase/N-acetylneuraminate lyase
MSNLSESSDLFTGIFAPVLTPMNSDYSVDINALVDHINDMIKNGCKGVVLFGSTGEAASFSCEEKKEVLKALIERGIPSKRLMLGVGHRLDFIIIQFRKNLKNFNLSFIDFMQLDIRYSRHDSLIAKI